MRQLLSVSLPEALAHTLARVTREAHLTRSEIVKLALRDFLRRYDAGEFDAELDERPELRGLEMLVPLGR